MGARARATFDQIRANRLASTILVMITLAVGILIGTVISNGAKAKVLPNSSDASQIQIPAPKQLSSAFSQIAKQLEPAVVNINTETVGKEETTPQPRQRRRQRPNSPNSPNNPNDDQDFEQCESASHLIEPDSTCGAPSTGSTRTILVAPR